MLLSNRANIPRKSISIRQFIKSKQLLNLQNRAFSRIFSVTLSLVIIAYIFCNCLIYNYKGTKYLRDYQIFGWFSYPELAYTCYVSETCRLFLGEGPARACGLEPGFYIGKGATAIVMPNISGTADGGQWLAPLDSPGCGLSDFGTGTQRGFSYTVRDDGIRMYTYCFYIECDYNGTRYGRWVPCAPDDVEWRYRVATLTRQQED